ncbi:unnamed protein product [Parnassius apollo]|uniref:(apollo) hypothetical protein n=1 Tax=Parnassius apollo TaxID=110799 RepID=A0A8S3XS14_PARAO|nr:unnamed protein product [Parnassius apollo]
MCKSLGIAIIVVASIAWQAHGAVNCTETGAGRFADPADTTCQNYTLCVYVSSTNTYLAYNYVCPTSSVFNPNTAQCTASSNYVCNVSTSTNNTTTSSVCTADGYVADPSSTNCTTYIECVQVNGTFTETTYTCPDGTYFNPNTTLCESDYNCTTTDSTFSCTAAGRFANTADTTCQTYYFCVLANNGTYVQYLYTCPTTSVFSPTISMCTTSYTCTNSG